MRSCRPRALLPLAAGLLAATPALATASLSCSAADRSLKFSADAVVSRGLGEQVPQFSGEIELLMKGVPEDFRKLALSLEHLTQRWLYGREVKLRLYREREGEPHGSVELVVETRRTPKDETEYRGRYELTVFTLASPQDSTPKTLKARGRAACSLG
jgi:hypothetical protein